MILPLSYSEAPILENSSMRCDAIHGVYMYSVCDTGVVLQTHIILKLRFFSTFRRALLAIVVLGVKQSQED